MNVNSISPEQFSAILDDVSKGTPLDQAIRGAKVGNLSDFGRLMRDSPHLAEALETARLKGGATQKQAQTYADPKLNDGHEPTVTEYDDGTPPKPADDESFQRVIDAAAVLGPGLIGQLRWVEQRCALAKRHPMDSVWLDNYEAFFRTGKLVMAIVAGLRAGKTTSSLRAMIPVALFGEHKIEAGEIAGLPIMSAKLDLATLNLNEVEITLCACGMTPARKDAEGFALPGGIGGTYKRTNGSGGGGVIELINAHGAKVRIMCLAANMASSVGYTAIGAFLDETVIWSNKTTAANPAHEILEAVQQRATTTFGTAKLIVSSSMYPKVTARLGKSAHQKLVEDGDTETVYIARLGEEGARRDTEARRKLAIKLGSADPKLLAPGDPNSPSIPAWASRLDLPIEVLYQQAGRDIDRLLGVFGGRMDLAVGGDMLSELEFLAACNRKLASAGSRYATTIDGAQVRAVKPQLQTFPNLSREDPRSENWGRDRRTGRAF